MSYIDYDHKDIKAFEEMEEDFKKYVQIIHAYITEVDFEKSIYLYDDVKMLTDQYLEEFAEEERLKNEM